MLHAHDGAKKLPVDFRIQDGGWQDRNRLNPHLPGT
jgi:hypothetical protein